MVDAGVMVYELKVGMTCTGCSGAIERILGAKPGKYNLLVNFTVINQLVNMFYHV